MCRENWEESSGSCCVSYGDAAYLDGAIKASKQSNYRDEDGDLVTDDKGVASRW